MKNYQNKTIRAYDKIAKKYYQSAKSKQELELIKPLQEFISLLHKNKGTILDLGCGPGHYSQILADKGFKVIGLDPSEEMLKIARKISPQSTFINTTMEKMDFKTNSFIGVWAAASFFHIPKKSLPQVLRKLNKYLINKGILFASVKEGEGEKFDSKTKYNIAIERYTSFYQLEELLKILKDNSFTIIRWWRWNSYKGTKWINLFASCKKNMIA